MQELNFQDIKPVKSAKDLIDISFRKARVAADNAKNRIKNKGDKINWVKDVELARLSALKNYLTDEMEQQQKNFPSIDDLPEFYKELINATIDYASLKKALGSLLWVKKTVNEMHKKYNQYLKRARNLDEIDRIRKEYYGRISSVLKQIKTNLDFLEGCRTIFRTYPTIKLGLATYAIAGFPNVGKSTLLKKLTGSKPEIKNYAFTTKTLLLGYGKGMYDKIQLVDTPGTLNRIEKMNDIELQAHYAMKYLAEKIIFVLDPTPTYPLADQEKLLQQTKKYNKDVIVYLSKTDIISDEELQMHTKRHPAAITNADDLKKALKIIN